MATVDIGAYGRPRHGEAVSGDAAFAVEVDGAVVGVVIDVLGHGEEAHRLAEPMRAHVESAPGSSVAAVLSGLHERFRGSRGAAVGVCRVESSTGELTYAGVGNTVIRCFGAEETRLVSRDGVVGGNMPRPAERALRLPDTGVVVMYTDGVSSHFAPEEYPGLWDDPAPRVAAVIVDRFGKAHDDATCLALRYTR